MRGGKQEKRCQNPGAKQFRVRTRRTCGRPLALKHFSRACGAVSISLLLPRNASRTAAGSFSPASEVWLEGRESSVFCTGRAVAYARRVPCSPERPLTHFSCVRYAHARPTDKHLKAP